MVEQAVAEKVVSKVNGMVDLSASFLAVLMAVSMVVNLGRKTGAYWVESKALMMDIFEAERLAD